MPIFRINEELHYFAHIPKCAGMSVEAYLEDRFGQIAFANDHYYGKLKQHRWTRTSPQHVDKISFFELVPESWIKSSFAVVRHPLDRVISAFNFRVVVNNSISSEIRLEDWFADFLANRETTPFMHDNHLCNQVDLIPDGAKIFRFEEGLDPIIGYLDSLSGSQDGPRTIARINTTPEVQQNEYLQYEVDRRFAEQVYETFTADYKAFSYALLPAKKKYVYAKPAGNPASSTRAKSKFFGIFKERRK